MFKRLLLETNRQRFTSRVTCSINLDCWFIVTCSINLDCWFTVTCSINLDCSFTVTVRLLIHCNMQYDWLCYLRIVSFLVHVELVATVTEIGRFGPGVRTSLLSVSKIQRHWLFCKMGVIKLNESMTSFFLYLLEPNQRTRCLLLFFPDCCSCIWISLSERHGCFPVHHVLFIPFYIIIIMYK